jgi:hypothetical protein
MAEQTAVDTYPKASNARAAVDAMAQANLATGNAKSSVVTEDATNWILTTVWKVDDC